MIHFEIEGEFIKLDQLLKAASIADSGGHAKFLISSGLVKVNGKPAFERGKKIRPGDEVIVDQQIIRTVSRTEPGS